jgi:probable HAF family extracellular repeat protein
VYPYYATDVNDVGVVVGQYFDEEGRVHSTLVQNGVHQSIDVPGAWGTQAQGINNLGQVVGTFVLDPTENSTAFIYANGTHVPLALPGALALPLDINDHGLVVGQTYDASFLFTSAFVVGPQVSQLLRYPGLPSTSLEGINNDGIAVGAARDSFGGTPLRYANGALSVPDPLPGGAGCSVNGISDSGDLVGGCNDPSGQGTSGFLFTGGESLRLTYGGDPSTFFRNVSASGIIVGYSNSGSFLVMRSKIVDPVPDLLDEGGVTDEADNLASMGRLVQGVAADGVARVVLRIPAQSAGQQFTVRLVNDHAPRTLSTSSQEDGALAAIGAQSSWVSQVTVTAETVAGASPMAFVLYKAPEDFPRADGQDETKASRYTVTLNDGTNIQFRYGLR